MEKSQKLLAYLSIGLLVTIPFFTSSTLKADNLTITLNAGEYRIINVDKGQDIIKMNGFSNLLVPGKPMLPAKGFMIALPPGAEVSSVITIGTSPVEIKGIHKIKPAPPFLPSNNRKDTVKKCLQEWQQNYDATYSSDQIYPQDVGKYLGVGGLRKYTFVRVAYFPFSYRPKSGRLTFNPSLIVSIDYNFPSSGSKEVERLLSDTMADDRASRLFVNYSQAKTWYTPEKGEAPKQSYDYVIITTETLQDAVNPFASWKQAIGYRVNVVTPSWIEANYSGVDLQEKIRNFLIDKYPQSQWGIEYVLLVGDIDAVPMRYCYPDPSDHDPSSDYCTPTDYYYADLTGDWDSDGDGYYGEYGEDNVDFVPEVHVGRIPWSDPTTVTSICQKLVNFENDNSSWKNNALLLGAMSNYANEDSSEWDRTDGANLMEEMISDMPTGWSYTKMYEKAGLNPCPYSCDYPITHANVVNDWSSNDYGIVNWWAHGGQTGAWRKWWAWDDGDGVPETESPDEISWQAFISNSDVSSLDDDHPSLIFSCSCNNGWPEVDNLGKELLKHGSSGIVTSTRISWYTIGWLDESWGGNASIDYYFFHYLITNDEKVGDALFDSKVYYLNNFFWWGEASQQNMFDFCLYGDPALKRGGVPSADLFIRGDANCDGRADISDVVYNLNSFFGFLPSPPCMDAADANDDGQWNIPDGFTLYLSQFEGYPPPPPPYPYPGPDPTEDELTCPGGCPYPPDTTVSPSDTFMIVDTQRLQGDSTSSFIILGTSHLNNAGYSIGFCFNPSQLRVDSVDILFNYSGQDNAIWNNEEGWCKIGAFAIVGVYNYNPPFAHKPLATVYTTISPNVAMEETLWLDLKNGCGGITNLFSDEVGNSTLATLIDGRILPPHFAFQTQPTFPLAMAEKETLAIIVIANDFLSQNFTLNVKAHPPNFFSWTGPVFSTTGTAVGTLTVIPHKGDKGVYYPSFYLSDTLGDAVLGPYELDVWPCDQSPLSGKLSGLLSKKNSPYRVVGDIIVPAGDSLIIEPGVELRFGWFNSPEKHCFKIRGILKALGTETYPITFTSNQFIPRIGDWESIEFDSANASTKLSHCRIEYAEKGLYCKYSSPHIEKNLIDGNLYGIYCDHSTPLILNNEISRNIYGVYCSSSSPLIRENEITQNSNPGITCTGELSSPLIEHNEIISNGSNFFLNRGEIECKYKSSPIVQGNLIQGKLGISGTESCSPLIYNNLICVKECGVSFWQWSGESMISNIVNNTIIGKGGEAFLGISCGQGVYSIANNIITGYQAGIDQRESSLRINYNDVWGNGTNFSNCAPGVGDTTWGENPNGIPCDSFYNIIRNPLFCDPDSGDYHLAKNSPCVGAGQDSLGNPVDIGAFPVGCPPIGIERERRAKIPQKFSLSSNYPNPFNPVTQIRYALPQGCRVRLEIYNILGQKVVCLVDREQTPGYKTVSWNAKDMSSGIYFYHIHAGNFTQTRKMVVLK